MDWPPDVYKRQLMGDVNRMEHVWSHVLGYLYGAYISTAIIAVCLLVYDLSLIHI